MLKTKWPSKEFFVEQYEQLGKSAPAISKEYKIPLATVSWLLRRYEIKIRKAFQTRLIQKSKMIDGEKWCQGCKRDLPVGSFNKSHRERLGRTTYCRECTALKAKKYFKKTSANRSRFKSEIIKRMGDKCSRCGASGLPISCYDFHHLDKDKKEYTIAYLLGYPKRLEAELCKCSLVCSNCHKIIHFGEDNADAILGRVNLSK